MENTIIDSCKKYMFIKKDTLTPKENLKSMENNLQKIMINGVSKKSTIKNVVQNSTQQKTPIKNVARMSTPIDTLFWSCFIILNGEQIYELDHSFKKEKDFKIASIEKLRAIKSELKALKLRLNEIENELLNEKKITIKSLIALSLLYKINVMYVWNNKYFEIINNADEKLNIIIHNKDDDIISDDISETKINYYKNNYLCIENINKPIKAITSYTRDELITIVDKLEIKDISTKKTKKEMYEKILQKIN